MNGIRWLAGDPELCRALGQAWADPKAAGAEITLLRERPGRRRHCRVRWEGGSDLFVKVFPAAGGRHGLRRKLARGLRVDAARREWRMLGRLTAARVPAPTPRALGILSGGDRILAVDFLEGRPLDQARAEPGLRGARLATELGRLLASLHAAGVVHRDLHPGNVFLTEGGPRLVDLQLARTGRSRRARLRDIGDLDSGLEPGFSLADRIRLRAAALGLDAPFDASARRSLRDAGEASLARARAHSASRRRRALRRGRRFARARHAGSRGLRLREIEPEALDDALTCHAQGRGETLKRDRRAHVTAVRAGDRPVVVKEYLRGGLARGLADLLRGSPARRAWLAGVGLEAHGIGAATPLAFLERRWLGLPVGSRVVLEDLRPALPAHELASDQGEAVVGVLARLALRLHGLGIHHGDLQADHVWLSPGEPGLAPRLIDLESVRFRARLSDRSRCLALAQLNASLPDAAAADLRRQAFRRYALLLPFAQSQSGVRTEIVRISRARHHRWSGAGCRDAAGLSPEARP